MSKKVVFVGPSGAGKTTLRKFFFEGGNASKLLEYALEPTYGKESLILRLPGLKEDIGVFDLAGQENQRWLEFDDKSIFIDAKIILIVLDITAEIDLLLDFIRKVIDVRNDITPDSFVYVLMHKIDLVGHKKIRTIRTGVRSSFFNEKLLKILFTSLKKQFITQTFSYFIEILKKCLQNETQDDNIMFSLINDSVKLVNIINDEITITKKFLEEKLNRPSKIIEYLIESFINKDHIERKIVNKQEILSLTDLGKTSFKELLKTFSVEFLNETETDKLITKYFEGEKTPSFIGAFVADKDGRTLLKIELFEDALEKLILTSTKTDEDVVPVAIDLIPMFISALEKFSEELNIQDLAGFSLEGSNLKMNVFSYDYYTVTFFMNPDININPVQTKIYNYFKNMFEDNKEQFNITLDSGQIDNLYPLMEKSRKWLEDLNTYYENMIIQLEAYDTEHGKILYNKLDDLYQRVDLIYSLTLEKIKKLKVNLMQSIIEQDFEELRKIAGVAKELSAKYAI